MMPAVPLRPVVTSLRVQGDRSCATIPAPQNKRPAALCGEDVRRLRTKIGLTQPQFAWLIGVSRATVQAWERAERKRCSTMPDGLRQNIRTIIEEVRKHGANLVQHLRAAVAEHERERAEIALLIARVGPEESRRIIRILFVEASS